MASKRVFQEEGEGSNDERDLQGHGKRRHGDAEQAEARHLSSLVAATGIPMNELALRLEPMFRKITREEIERGLQLHRSSCCELFHNQQRGSTGGRILQLSFANKLPPMIFTQSKITAEGGVPLQIELRDADRVVREQSFVLKVQIYALDGDFGNEDWTAKEFDDQILSPREGKGALLVGERVVIMKNGVGSVTNKIFFSDNSCWTRNKKFRLGVKVITQSNSIGAEIREGRSEAFRVMDNRGEAYKKHDCPSLNDAVWRIKKIGKGGKLHKQLSSNGIKTVKHLLQSYVTNQALLQEEIGKAAGKSWDTIISHAKDCDIDNDERYFYHAPEEFTSLLFNCIYEVVEVSFRGQNFRFVQSLNLEEKRMVERVKQKAYKNLKDVVPYETTTHELLKTLTSVEEVAPCIAPEQQFNLPIAYQGQQENWASTSTSTIGETTHSGDLIGCDQQLTVLGEMPQNWYSGEQLIPGSYVNDGNGLPLSVSQIDQFASQLTPYYPLEQLNVDNPLLVSYGDGGESSNYSSIPNSGVVYMSSKGKPKTIWGKIQSALATFILYLANRKALKSASAEKKSNQVKHKLKG